MENQPQPIGDVLKRIPATPTLIPQLPTIPLRLSEQQRAWCNKWLRIQTQNQRPLMNLEQMVFEFCRAYSKNPRQGYRLIIHGPNGSGKTHTAKAIHRWAQAVKMKIPLDPIHNDEGDTYQLSTVQYLFWPRVVDGFKRGEWTIVDEAVQQSLVIIDDIGAEHDPSGIGREKLYYILERREQRYTVLTTNVPNIEWEVKFEKRIASRFLRNCVTVDLTTVPDFGAR